MKTIQDIAALLAAHLTPRNPIFTAQIITDNGLGAGNTPMVVLSTNDAARSAVYLPPHAIVEGGKVFVTRMGHRLTDPLICLATNYQGIATVGGGGLGGSPLGTGPLGS